MSEKITLFDRFGGTRKMADHLGEAPSTVQSWKSAGRIPAHRQPAVLAKGDELGLGITADDVIFPLGRDDSEAAATASATNHVANIRERDGEADSHGPFSLTSSPTCGHPQPREESASCPSSSSPEAKAA